jgi:colanic acid/amylovoran biosynthesis glycosyltransferase
LVFNHSFFPISETFIYRQINGAVLKGNQVVYLGYDFLNEDIFPVNDQKIRIKEYVNLLDKVSTKFLKGFFYSYFKKNIGLSLFNFIKLKKQVKELNPDLIHAHFGTNGLTIFPLAKSLNIPLVVSFHGIDASPEALRVSRYKNYLPLLFEYAKSIIVVSPHMIDTLGLSAWQNKTHFVPYGVESSKFNRTHDALKDNTTLRLLHSGRMVSKKGVPDLIRVCIRLHEKGIKIQLDVIGDGPELQLCKDIANESNTHFIKFWGALPHNEVKNFMNDADIFILNSRTGENGDMEGMPNAILEAMSMGLPVVSTYHAGIPEVITTDVDGLLVNEKDNNALELALERLINDASLRDRIGEAAKKRILDKFSVVRETEGVLQAYN